ncbi:MAG: capsular polysaccharide biosynthesis protein [Pseudomonadota bacterium]
MKPLHAYSGGMFRQRHRRMLELAGWDVGLGWPGSAGHVAAWGQRPVSHRARWVARQSGAALLTIEDGFLRSVHPGVTGEPTLSLVIDDLGIYYDASRPSRLEVLVQTGEEDPEAGALIARIREIGLSKYTPMGRAESALPTPGYVLIIDQTRGDSSIAGAGADAATFTEMLAAARAENPGRPIVIRAHPDCSVSAKTGHFQPRDLLSEETLLSDPMNPWPLIEGAAKVYTVSSQLGFEAVLAGKDVHCFGLPFYAGWGLTQDRQTCPRRGQARSVAQVFTAAYRDYPIYYDPYRDRLTGLSETIETLGCLSRQWGGPSKNLILTGFRTWKRRHTLRFAPPLAASARFTDDPTEAGAIAQRTDAVHWVWASKMPESPLATPTIRVEDGFLRSIGLGAELVDAASLVFDDLGIYYDPRHQSRLEVLIAKAADLTLRERKRADALILRINETGISKYNQGAAPQIDIPHGQQVILVPGQVEDDASVRLGCGEIRTNRALLQAARAANPDAFLIYKPHPDVEAGLRPGAIDQPDARLADHVAEGTAPAPLISLADQIWTLTSLMGFEALLRGKQVTCLGLPFYAGWGLTEDQMACPRRLARSDLTTLVHAALIAYPRYLDPVTHLPCEVELVVERLASGEQAHRPWWQVPLTKAQGWCAGHGVTFWR